MKNTNHMKFFTFSFLSFRNFLDMAEKDQLLENGNHDVDIGYSRPQSQKEKLVQLEDDIEFDVPTAGPSSGKSHGLHNYIQLETGG